MTETAPVPEPTYYDEAIWDMPEPPVLSGEAELFVPEQEQYAAPAAPDLPQQIHASRTSNGITLRFDFSPAMVDLLHSTEGAKWNETERIWTVPEDSFDALRHALAEQDWQGTMHDTGRGVVIPLQDEYRFADAPAQTSKRAVNLEKPKRRLPPQQDLRSAFEKSLRETLESIRSPYSLRRCLEYAGRFPDMSARNALAMMKQDPGATQVRTADSWKELGFSVRDDAHPIYYSHPEKDDGTGRIVFRMEAGYDVRDITPDKPGIEPPAAPAPSASTIGERLEYLAPKMRGAVNEETVPWIVSGACRTIAKSGGAQGLSKNDAKLAAECAAYIAAASLGIDTGSAALTQDTMSVHQGTLASRNHPDEMLSVLSAAQRIAGQVVRAVVHPPERQRNTAKDFSKMNTRQLLRELKQTTKEARGGHGTSR